MAWLFSVSLLSSQAALRSPRLSDKAFFLSLSPASFPPPPLRVLHLLCPQPETSSWS